MIKNTSQFIEVWPISCLNDSETHERVLKGVNIQKIFVGKPLPEPPLKACTFGARFGIGRYFIFILDPRLLLYIKQHRNNFLNNFL